MRKVTIGSGTRLRPQSPVCYSVSQIPLVMVYTNLPSSTATLKWTRVGLLGKGTNTKLYAARSITTGEMLAVKQAEIHRTRSEQDDARQVTTLNSLKAERNALEQLDHPNIVHCFGFEETPNFFSV